MIANPSLQAVITRLTTGTAIATGSHTPTANDFLIAFAYCHTTGGTAFTDTATCAGNGQTWTKRGAALSADAKQYLVVFTAGPVAAPSAGATTITVNTSVSEAHVGVVKFPTASSTLDTTTPYVNSGAAAVAAGTAPTATITAPADPSNAFFVFWGHLASEVTGPRTGWTEVGDSKTAPGTSTLSAVEGQYLIDAGEQTVGATWATSAVSIYSYVEVKNGKALGKNAAIQATADSTDTSVTAGNADSGWNAAGTVTYVPPDVFDLSGGGGHNAKNPGYDTGPQVHWG